jgi:hypothetical protein
MLRQMMLDRLQQRMQEGPAPQQGRGPQRSGMGASPQWYRAPMPGMVPQRGEWQAEERGSRSGPEGLRWSRVQRGPAGRGPAPQGPHRSGRRDV